MYGLPITLFFLDYYLESDTSLSVENGHLFAPALGFGNVHLLSFSLIAIGTALVLLGWREIYKAKGKYTTAGIYRYFKHPQYLIIITGGMLVEYPTIISGVLWLFIIIFYYRLSRMERKFWECRQATTI